MSGEANREVNVGEGSSSLSSSRTQGTQSDCETTPGDESSSILNLFVSITNSETTGNGFTLEVKSSRRKNYKNPCQNSEGCTLAVEEPQMSSDVEEIPVDTQESVLDVALSQQLKEECNELKEVAKAWINTYETSQFEAVRSMLELILHSTGVLQKLSREQALTLDQLTTDTFDDLMSDPQVEPLLLEDPFFENLLNFLKLTLVGDVCLGDVLIMKRIHCLLSVFAQSTWVSSRYCALMIGSSITAQYTAYCSQLDTELRDVLTAGGDETDVRERMEVAENFFKEFLEFVILCQRDVVLTVRKLACQIYFSWCVKEQLLMTDCYLRHVYWALYDDSPSIRSLAITTCGSLYKSEYVVKTLEEFMKKTLSSIVKRAQDENTCVAAVALETISGVHRQVPWLLKEISLDSIFMLVYEEDSKAAKASKFIHDVLEDRSNTNLQFIFNTLLFTEESMVELGEDVDVGSAVSVLVENLFSHSHLQLTDWAAWRQLLLGNTLDQSERLQELACLLLMAIINHLSICADDRYFIETDFPPAPSLDSVKDTKKKSHEISNEKLKTECLNHLVQMTSDLGPQLLLLWEKYKNNRKGLIKLVTIPQYFNGSIDSLDIKEFCCYLTYFRNALCDSSSLDAIHRSLACVYHLMLASSKWKHDIPKFECILFKAVTEQFLDACSRLAKKTQHQMNNLKIVKQAFYLSKFFDVTKTCLIDDAIYALRFGTSKRIAKIICPTAMMCLYILEWQLKNIIEEDLPRDKMAARLYKIQSQSRTLVIQLEHLITNQISLVRETAYSVLCRLFMTFSPFNAYIAHYRLIHLPPPSLEIMEWLNYGLACQVPQDRIPEDEKKFEMSCVALQMFCSLMQAQVLNLYYVGSILCYFQFHRHPKNYNSILESAFQGLARMDDFAGVILDSLIWMKTSTNYDVEEITTGFCSAALPKLHSTKLIGKIARDIIGYGLAHIKSQKHYFIFPILALFVKLLENKDAEELYSSYMNTFHLQFVRRTELADIRVFLAAFRQRRQSFRAVEQARRESV